MAQQVLLLGDQLGEPASVGQLEYRVEAEAMRAAWLRRDGARENTLALKGPTVRQGEDGDTPKGRRRRAAGCRAQGGQQGANQCRTVAVVLWAGEVRGLDAGPAAEQRHLQPRVVGQGWQPAQQPAGLGLLFRVLPIGRAILGNLEPDPDLFWRHEVHWQVGEDGPDLAELALVRRGEQQAVQ